MDEGSEWAVTSGTLVMSVRSLHPWLVSLLCAVLAASASAAGNTVPKPSGRVTDQAKVFSEVQRQELESTLIDYENETSHEIAVLTVESLNGEAIEPYALRVARAWKLGKAGADNGILVLLAPNDRQVYIELGIGMANHISDAQAKAIVDESMTPAFRRGDFAGGLRRGVGRLMVAARAYALAQ